MHDELSRGADPGQRSEYVMELLRGELDLGGDSREVPVLRPGDVTENAADAWGAKSVDVRPILFSVQGFRRKILRRWWAIHRRSWSNSSLVGA